ncbi:MAG: MmgE/PrpD family protein [Spongiibacteraceae bacterium]|nr:MmgE/PrpD family protein [Spongiibacteraceae bacterium]
MSTQADEGNLSYALAQFITSVEFSQLSTQAIRQTRYALLDALGVSIAASTLGEGVNTFIDWVQEQQVPGRCSVFGQTFLTSASMAAFANGSLAHALDFEDSHDQALVHPNAAVIPAVLAVAQEQGNISGKDLLTAIAVGCEVSCRLGFAAASALDKNSWYPPPIFSAYGATAAVAKLLALNEQQILDAFSLTLSQATCSAQIKHNSRSHIRAIRDAFPAQTGVVSAQLAKKGLLGFSQPFEGRDGFFAGFSRGEFDAAALTESLGECFAIEDVSFKPWPCCRGTHIPIELALRLCRERHLSSADIDSITVTSNALNRMLAEPISNKRAPITAIDAKFSIPFVLPVPSLAGKLTLILFPYHHLATLLFWIWQRALIIGLTRHMITPLWPVLNFIYAMAAGLY